MLILGIESSCDETAAALVSLEQGRARILAERISSQAPVHEPYGGVVPELASREHLYNLPFVIHEIMQESGLAYRDLSAIAVTRGPGLKGCLLMGCGFAKGLSLANELPLVGVNHIEAHIHGAMLDNEEVEYPFLALVVSGGHTEIIDVRGLGEYRVVARTIDDAAGEAFDKSANLLGFAYPGGAALAELADRCVSAPGYILPRVMQGQEGFSFSGLKTAIALLVAREQPLDDSRRGALAAAIQEAIVEALYSKVRSALRTTRSGSLVVTGGVAANRRLRERMQSFRNVRVYFPALMHCMDNAAMVAFVGAKRFAAGQTDQLDFSVLSRWPVEEARI